MKQDRSLGSCCPGTDPVLLGPWWRRGPLGAAGLLLIFFLLHLVSAAMAGIAVEGRDEKRRKNIRKGWVFLLGLGKLAPFLYTYFERTWRESVCRFACWSNHVLLPHVFNGRKEEAQSSLRRLAEGVIWGQTAEVNHSWCWGKVSLSRPELWEDWFKRIAQLQNVNCAKQISMKALKFEFDYF